MTRPSTIIYRWLGRTPYPKGLEIQKATHQQVLDGGPPTILACEHEHVFTMGRRSSSAEILNAGGIPTVEVDRGGRVTYHGPGQAVMYPILSLQDLNLGVQEYVRMLEETSIRSLAEHAIVADRDQVNAGVWVGDEKITAIGVHVGRGVTTHGLALNVQTDLSAYQRIVPCGLAFHGVTSMARLIDNPPSVMNMADQLANQLAVLLECKLVVASDP
ncbi:MAG: lipoate-protein ligase B [Myxococcales bacterium]|nr:lipoate-protein ligase B [Myxococcales bacterium]|tara:strand:+ start:111 stop:758 length:648 start_codon:yes stop_codon:yes gene_type:complete